MNKSYFTFFFLAVIGPQLLFSQNTYTLDSTELKSRVVKDSLDIPWEILWGPDDHLWVTERFGRVSRIDPANGSQKVLLDISSAVYERSEAGMLGMVLHPDFSNSPHVFIAYTYWDGNSVRERLVKFNYNGSILQPLDTLIEDIKGFNTHIGCRLIVLPDNSLLMSTGDAQDRSLPQNKSSVVGKILRMNLDGSIPTDNPDPSSYVWSYGHRNAQGLWRAPNGIIYSSEHGPTTDDELNILNKNRNYGWPTVAGFCDSPPEVTFCNSNNVVEPLAAWTPTIAPSDIIWYGNNAIPEFDGKLLMTVLKDKSLIAFEFNASGDSVISEKKYFKNEFGRLRDICISPDGKIYLATNGNSWANNNPFTHSIVELTVVEKEDDKEKPSSIIQTKKKKLVSVFPNPVKSGQHLQVSSQDSFNATIELYDMMGKPVIRQLFDQSSAIEVNMTPGIYFWTIRETDGEVKMGKLIVQ